jgi:hypothetical protein
MKKVIIIFVLLLVTLIANAQEYDLYHHVKVPHDGGISMESNQIWFKISGEGTTLYYADEKSGWEFYPIFIIQESTFIPSKDLQIFEGEREQAYVQYSPEGKVIYIKIRTTKGILWSFYDKTLAIDKYNSLQYPELVRDEE